MHENTAKELQHSHEFGDISHANEKKTLYVIVLTALTMGVEITTGMLTGSMALLADGWHMGTHALALGITYFAYVLSRRYQSSKRYTFGTGKFGILAGYTSALFLGATALYMLWESMLRFIHPVEIAFNEAILVAVVGLVVNVLSVWMLHTGDHQHHHHDDNHDHKHDHNLRAAYLHVLADALTSVLAIVALLAGKFFGLTFLDPVMGIVGGVLIWRWAWGLLKSSAMILLDGSTTKEVTKTILEKIQEDKDSHVIDLHVWQLSSNGLAAIISVVTKENRTPSEYYSRLSIIKNLQHITVETHTCSDEMCQCVQL